MMHQKTKDSEAIIEQREQANSALTKDFLNRIWPDPKKRINLLQALESSGKKDAADRIKQTLDQANATASVMNKPIVAILGELNSGKSSVVAGFLSEEGRSRLPRGVEAEFGTHRFVYWVPQKWLDNKDDRDKFETLVRFAHENKPEYLDEDPEKAAKQYRSGRDDIPTLKTPLIAGDPALNDLGRALLDCPDVQTKDQGNGILDEHTDTPNIRLELLGKAAGMCSAFFVVWDRAKVRDGDLLEVLGELRTRLESVAIYLLINKIRPEDGQPMKTRNDLEIVKLINDHQIKENAIYGAFDFDIGPRGSKPGWKILTPVKLVERAEQEAEKGLKPLPKFFQLSTAEQIDSANSDEESGFLESIFAQLKIGRAQQNKLDDDHKKLEALISTSRADVLVWTESQLDRATEVWDGMFSLCKGVFTDPETREPLLLLSRITVNMTSELTRLAQRFKNVVLPQNEKIDEFKQLIATESQVKFNFATSEPLSRQMHNLRWVNPEIPIDKLQSGWDAVISNYLMHSYVPSRLVIDNLAKTWWSTKETTWKKMKAVSGEMMFSIGVFIALGAGACVAIIDGGITFAALTLSVDGVAAGVAVIGAGTAFAGFVKGMVEVNTLPNLSNFFALACDAFGIPRKLSQEKVTVEFGLEKIVPFDLPEPTVPNCDTITQLEDLSLWEECNEHVEVVE
jgi:hypothetical protein